MNLSSEISIIYLLFGLILNFVPSFANNSTHEQTIKANVLTSFLKVPWINLNSSWKDAVAPACRDDIAILFESAEVGEMWALKMLWLALEECACALVLIDDRLSFGAIRALRVSRANELINDGKAESGNKNDWLPEVAGAQLCTNNMSLLDATSKIPAGIFNGNIRDLGMFDECVGVRSEDNPANIQGQHCMVSMAMPTKFFGDVSEILTIQKLSVFNPSAGDDLSLTTAVCLPSTCSEQDVNGLVNASIAITPELSAFEVSVARVKCSNVGHSAELSLGTTLTILFFAVITICLISCTLCDFILRSRSGKGSMALKTAAQFSLYTSVIRLSSTKSKSNTMPALNGIRFLTSCCVILGHRIVGVFIGISVNTSDIINYRQTAVHTAFFTLPFAVDTFFVLSGFLMTISYLQTFRSGKKVNIFSMYFHRYIRLTPCVVILLLVTIFIVPHLGTGPNWESIGNVSVKFCEKNWWLNLLYLQNIVNVDEMCLLHTWYIAVEMQLFWLSPIILYPMFYRPKLGLFILSLFVIAALVIPGVQMAGHQWVFFWNLEKRASTMFPEFLRSYLATYNRALPYMIGILLGYEMFYNKRQITKYQATSNWILTILFVTLSIWTGYRIQPNGIGYSVIWEVISVTATRLGWSLAVGWIIYACTQGYGGPVTKLLSLPMFVPLSRLSYSVYLVHFILQVATTATERTAEYRSPFLLIYLLWGDLAISIIFASVMYLCVECPTYTLEKILRSGRSPANVAHRATTAKQTTLSATVKNYLDSTKSKTNSDLVIETITSNLDFWQTICDELNRLNKGPLRTPIEWSKAWQDWRSELLNMDDMVKAQSTGVRNEGHQSQTKATSLEKELMVFLAAVNCSLINNSSYKDLEIVRSKSESNFCNRRNGGPVRLSIVDSEIINDAKNKISGSGSADGEYVSSKL